MINIGVIDTFELYRTVLYYSAVRSFTSFFNLLDSTCTVVVMCLFAVVSTSLIACDEVLWYMLQRLYGIFFWPVAITSNIKTHGVSLADVSYYYVDNIFDLIRDSNESFTGCIVLRQVKIRLYPCCRLLHFVCH